MMGIHVHALGRKCTVVLDEALRQVVGIAGTAGMARIQRRHVERILPQRGVRLRLTSLQRTEAPQVHQDLLVSGLEDLTLMKLKEIVAGLDLLVNILGAQELPPRLVLSPELNLPGKEERTSHRKTLNGSEVVVQKRNF